MASDYAPRPGCPLCSIVSTPYPSLLQSPRSPFFNGNNNNNNGAPAPQIVHKDEKVTVYLERANPVSSKGHLVIVLNLHVPSIYMLSSSDLPLLLHMQSLAQTLLTKQLSGTLLSSSSSPNAVPPTPMSPNPGSPNPSQAITFSPESDPANQFNIGFIVSPFSDPKIPVSDHVHLHAYIGNMDLAGWWRKLNYSGMGWWAIDDLIAEIREQTSNNRVKSAYPHSRMAPINQVPDAGARVGFANGLELPSHSVIEDPGSPRTSRAPARVPSLSVTGEDEPITPRAAESGASEEESAILPRISSASQVAQGKKPMGPRTKETGNSIQLGQVSSSASPSPSPEPVASS
ncbi:hypothetical protein M407DRAFT_246547 [Tulasnella calospora MUT 4182]|uniref:HIT domain-containing protein n=1 Tax=Tulasnella calospora MUT 4182 TaxID=1051891 RepID=A0A0C3Q4G7_9AGAM|nr:hypothetical protein M407DRAFT_246547 [Tulasnella calospora MUT 4182]